MSRLEHIVMRKLQPPLTLCAHITRKKHAALRTHKRRQRARLIACHRLRRHINQRQLHAIVQLIAHAARRQLHLRPLRRRQQPLPHFAALLRQRFVRQHQRFHSHLPQQIHRAAHMVIIIMAHQQHIYLPFAQRPQKRRHNACACR